MNNIQNLIVLDKTKLLELLAETKKQKAEDIKELNYIHSYLNGKIYTLEILLQQSKPLEPIVSQAFDAGAERGFEEKDLNSQYHKDITVPTLQEYLKTFNL